MDEAEGSEMKHEVIAMKKHPGVVSIDGIRTQNMKLPEGCTGILFVFESKKASKAYWGKDVEMVRIKEVKK